MYTCLDDNWSYFFQCLILHLRNFSKDYSSLIFILLWCVVIWEGVHTLVIFISPTEIGKEAALVLCASEGMCWLTKWRFLSQILFKQVFKNRQVASVVLQKYVMIDLKFQASINFDFKSCIFLHLSRAYGGKALLHAKLTARSWLQWSSICWLDWKQNKPNKKTPNPNNKTLKLF